MYSTMNAKEIRTIIGIIGNVLSVFISLSHMPKFIQICKKKSVDEDFQQHRHVVTVMKCSLWVLYGLPLVQKDSILVTTSNGVGLVIEAIYLAVFLFYCDKDLQLERQTEVDDEQFRCMYLPFWFSFTNFINAGIWIAYSVIYKIDVYVLVVNVVGALACAIRLIILCCSAVRCLLLSKRVVPCSSVPVV
ncbi:unnamed protein product [Brassica rapa]|uniref:Bidirectional sugar transporter SWEET n=1 Tax=Brassica campestris TaxID=3711 RepID=A0A8D9DIZ9_BRACM|nr:unnamed protein product [Brassica rapa]